MRIPLRGELVTAHEILSFSAILAPAEEERARRRVLNRTFFTRFTPAILIAMFLFSAASNLLALALWKFIVRGMGWG